MSKNKNDHTCKKYQHISIRLRIFSFSKIMYKLCIQILFRFLLILILYSMTAHKRTGSAESIRSGHPLDEEHKGRMSFSYDADHSDNDGNLLYLTKRIFIVITIN